LKEKIPPGKQRIGDQGYKDETVIATSNPLDSAEVKELKRRAKAHHKAFNGRLKDFRILSERF
jgi:hypothetical protein